jgi:hypothetical protein
MPDGHLDPQLVKTLLEADFSTGQLFWKKRPSELFPSDQSARLWNAKHAGKNALNCVNGAGYRYGRIFRSPIMAHRAIWCLANDGWPKDQIDHINGNREDNRLVNLRNVTKLENSRNQRIRKENTSGVLGVYWLKNAKKWRAFVCVDYKKIHLGVFDDFEEAVLVRKEAEKKYGFHKNNGLNVKDLENA